MACRDTVTTRHGTGGREGLWTARGTDTPGHRSPLSPCVLTWLLGGVWGFLGVAAACPALPVFLLLGADTLHPGGWGVALSTELMRRARGAPTPDGTYCLFSWARDFSSALQWSSMLLRLAALYSAKPLWGDGVTPGTLSSSRTAPAPSGLAPARLPPCPVLGSGGGDPSCHLQSRGRWKHATEAASARSGRAPGHRSLAGSAARGARERGAVPQPRTLRPAWRQKWAKPPASDRAWASIRRLGPAEAP